jgi:hypothetical protein
MTVLRIVLALCPLALVSALLFFACNADDETGLQPDDLGPCAIAYDASVGKYPPDVLPGGQTCAWNTECYVPVDPCPADLASEGGGSVLYYFECVCADAAWGCSAVSVISACPEAGVDAGTLDARTLDAPGQ